MDYKHENRINNMNNESYIYTVVFRITREQRYLVEQIVDKTNKYFPDVYRDLLNLGLKQFYSENRDIPIDQAKLKLFQEVNKVKDLQSVLSNLAMIKPYLKPEEFKKQCQENNIDPIDVEEIQYPRLSKRDLVRMFLQALFTDRTEGMPVSRVLELANNLQFSESMVRQEARKLSIFSKKRKTHDGIMNIYYPPEG